MALAGLLQILTSIRGALFYVAELLAKFIPFPEQNILLVINIIISLFIGGKISALFPDNNKIYWFLGISGGIFYLLKYYGI